MLLSKMHKRVLMRKYQRGFFIAGGGSASRYQITNSIRLRKSAGAYLTRTPSSSGNRRTYTRVIFIKRGQLDTAQDLMAAGAGNSNTVRFNATTNTLMVRVGNVDSTSNRVFRDPPAHGCLTIAVDTTQATATDRLKAWWNNELITWSTYAVPAQNTDTDWNTSGVTMYCGSADSGSQTADVIASNFFNLDGHTKDYTSFIEQDSNGVWVPKAYAGGFSGTNSSHLDFKDVALTSGSNAGLGKDVSGNGNYWNTTNISVTSGVTYDSFTDTPTNNYSAPTSLDRDGTLTFVNGGLEVTGGGYASYRVNINLAADKWYWEVEATAIDSTAYPILGVAVSNSQLPVASGGNVYSSNSPTGAGSIVIWNNGGLREQNTLARTLTSYSAGQTLCFALDMINFALYIGKVSGGTITWMNSGDPTSGASRTGAASTALTSGVAYSPVGSMSGGSPIAKWNLGQRPLAASSVPAGYKTPCTTNLPAVAVSKPSNGFKTTLATEANIYADVATARGGWTNYVDILKNRDAAESWAWQFSHDSSNEYTISSGSVVRQTARAMSGAQAWVGYSIRIDAAYGTAGGSVSHTNGADTTVTHNVGSSARQMILLFPRAGGSAVKVYHPDLASGKLLDLCGTSAETTDATIKTVLSTSFKIDTAVATGTYDYLVLSELSGFFALVTYTGNGSSDGSNITCGGRPKMIMWRDAVVAASSFIVQDASRSPYNVIDSTLFAESTSAVSTGFNIDIHSTGYKHRHTAAGYNGSGERHVAAVFLDHAFGGSNVAPAPAR